MLIYFYSLINNLVAAPDFALCQRTKPSWGGTGEILTRPHFQILKSMILNICFESLTLIVAFAFLAV